MLITISGSQEPKKLRQAEQLVQELPEKATKYYMFTGIPFGKTAVKAAEKKLRSFRSKGYMALEIAKDPEEAIEWIKARRMADHLLRTAKGESETGDQRSAADARESVIIDSISTMTANVLFDADEEGELPADFGQDITEAQAEEKAQSLLGQLKKLTEYADTVIILTEEPAAAPLYGKNEDLYLKALRTMNEAVFEMSDEVHRI